MLPSLPLAIGFGPAEISLIVLLILLLFGAKKLPALARGVGESIGEFKKARKEIEDEESKEDSKAPEKEDS